MDAFFAAVEERDRPELQGLPIVVGADPRGGRGRGVVSTANYEARAYGIHSAMPISQAWRRSEAARRRGDSPAVFIRPNFERYAEVSRRIVAILRRYVSVVEEASIDEMYFDLSFAGTFEKAKEICQAIKNEIKAVEHLTASVGIGPNKLLAKIASDFKKPDGLTVVEEREAEAFLAPLPIRKIPGIGPKTEVVLLGQGMKTVEDLKKFSRDELQEMFGKWGLDLYEKVRGCDDSPIQEEYEPKSVGEQETFQSDTRDPKFILDRLRAMCENTVRRLTEASFKKFRTIVIIVRFADFETKSRAFTLTHPTDSLKDLESEAFRLILPFLDRRDNPRLKLIRMIGVRIEKLIK
jgi:nucleotidyltransferase/DNA polymerase involved in DNA repair